MIRVLNLVTVPVRTLTTTQRLQTANQPPVAQYGSNEVLKSVLTNGLNVAIHKPEYSIMLSSCTILFQVGSRNETEDNFGVTHFLRAASIMSGRASTDFIRARLLQQHGAYLSCCSDRQYFAYSVRAPAIVIREFKNALLDTGVKNYYPEWEMDAIREIVRADLKRRDPVAHVMDLIQKALFAYPLNNSIYCAEGRVDSITGEDLSKFVQTYFKPNVCCVGGSGMPIVDIEYIGINVGTVADKTTIPIIPTRARCGYEYYDTGPGGTTYIALAVQGPGQCDFQACLAFAILSAAVGHWNVTQGHSFDRIIQKPLGAIVERHDCETKVTAFTIAHAEIGCFGILIKTSSSFARCVGFRAAKFLNDLKCISADQILLGKKRLLLGLALQDSSSLNTSLNQAMQASRIPYENSNDYKKAIDGITVECVQSAAQTVSLRAYGLALAVVGDVEAAPHDGELRVSL